MLDLKTRVVIPDMDDLEGRIELVSNYISGYQTYTVTWFDAAKKEKRTQRVHEADVQVVDTDDIIELPAPDPNLGLGTHVSVMGGETAGVITGHHHSASGCVEYEVTHYEPIRGVVRAVLEGELLEPIAETTDVPVGAQPGSLIERGAVPAR